MAPHVVRNGSLGGRQRYHCRGCGTWFGETQGTPLYRLKTPAAEIGRALLLVMRRGSLRAAEDATGHKYETIGRWLQLAARHAAEIEDALVRDLELSTVEIDEFWSFVKKRTSAGTRLTRRLSGIAGAA
jgi:transposase-like protein